ncbi:MAG: hypothetical protein EOM92_11670 [Gammaproteobacteria bacterium]|nr:hypothetical protein [Gammaproteobacteria bacterium]
MNLGNHQGRRAWIDVARHISLADPETIDLIRERGSDVRIARTLSPNGEPVVIKLWNRRGLRGLLRRWIRTNPAGREWHALRRLRSAGLEVPTPLAYLTGLGRPCAHTEALITGDLGPCGDAVEHLKALIRRGDLSGEQVFVATIIQVTRTMISLGYLDTDHRLPNFVVTPLGSPVRLDFELNLWHPWHRLWTRDYGLMVGTLIGSFVFAVQPDINRVKDFARTLRLSLDPPKPVLRVAEERVDEMLSRQQAEIGLAIQVTDLWSDP